MTVPIECIDGPWRGLLVDIEQEGSTWRAPQEYTYATGRAIMLPEAEYRAVMFADRDGSEYLVYTCESDLEGLPEVGYDNA